jgi:3-hydroxyisobutyrate dehydrogenase-like beta-hydroxyacid dehydrogenase
MKIGVVGTGLMGSQIAIRLVQKGHKVTVFNRDRTKSERLRTRGLLVTEKPAEIGRICDFAVICVKDYDAVSNVSFEKNGLAENPNKDLIVLQCSTISPDESHSLVELFSSNGIKLVSVPIVGGVSAAGRGELVLIVSGSKSDYEKSLPVLRDLGKEIFYVGPDHGSASTLKLAININISLIAIALAEGLVLVRGKNIDPNTFVRILNSTYFKTGISENKGPKITHGEYSTSFSLANMVKDLNLALRTAQNLGLTLPTSASAHAIYRATQLFGLSNMDYTSVALFLLNLNGYKGFG